MHVTTIKPEPPPRHTASPAAEHPFDVSRVATTILCQLPHWSSIAEHMSSCGRRRHRSWSTLMFLQATSVSLPFATLSFADHIVHCRMHPLPPIAIFCHIARLNHSPAVGQIYAFSARTGESIGASYIASHAAECAAGCSGDINSTGGCNSTTAMRSKTPA